VRSIRDRLNAMQPEVASRPDPAPTGISIEHVTPGAERRTERGSHFVAEKDVDHSILGTRTFDRQIHPTTLARVPEWSTPVDANDILFLDTETTGLDRGTGTHVFLVGIGYFSGTSFRVEQHFLRDLHEEPSLLSELERIVREFRVLVTFNGRGFDWPLIHNRFILHGYRNIPELVHWDLLASARRIWRNRLGDCSLGNLERQLLGVQRFDDVPGFLIPNLYFDYLRSRDARPLRPVFSHNHEDIVSLARLADLMLLTEQDPILTLEHPLDRISYGLCLLNLGDLVSGEELILREINDRTISPELRYRVCKHVCDHLKRQQSLSKAESIWTSMLEHRWTSAEHALYPIVELAKLCEHRYRDYRRAISFVEKALNMAHMKGWSREKGELMHRYARLQRRVANQALTTRKRGGTGQEN
jgi:uncharacterized protein